MKKGLLLALTLLLCACTGKKYEVSYVVYYPNCPKTYKIVTNRVPYVWSNRGTNYITTGGTKRYFSTTAPIEILSCKEIKE